MITMTQRLENLRLLDKGFKSTKKQLKTRLKRAGKISQEYNSGISEFKNLLAMYKGV